MGQHVLVSFGPLAAVPDTATPSITETAFIAQPTARVFDAAADPQVQLEWDAPTLREVEKLTRGPLAPGARYRGNFKGFGVVTYEFAEFEPGRSFQHVARIPMGERCVTASHSMKRPAARE